MSISCDIYLPNDVRTEDILSVMGILLNHGKSKVCFDRQDGFYCKVHDVDTFFHVNGGDQEVQERKNIYVLPGHIPNMFTIHIQENQIDNVKDHMAFFHYDTDTENGMSPRYRNNPVKDKEWEQFQQDMLDLMPIEL